MKHRSIGTAGGTAVLTAFLFAQWLLWPTNHVHSATARQPQAAPTADAFLMQQVAVYTATTRLAAIGLLGEHAFVGASGQLLVLDISDPQNVHEVGRHATPNGSAATIRPSTHPILYFAVARGDLLGGPYVEMVDVGVPTALRRLGSYPPAALFVADLHHRSNQPELYVSERSGTDPALTILDGSLPAQNEAGLRVLNRITATVPAAIIAGPEEHLIFNHGSDGIAIRTQGITPTVVSTLDLAGGEAMVWHRKHLYRLAGNGELQVIDISDITKPTLVNTVTSFPSFGTMVLNSFRGRLFVTQSDSSSVAGGGLRAYDLVDPVAPTPAGHYLEADLHPSDLARRSSLFYLTSFDVDDGLRIIRYLPTEILELAALFDIELNGQRLNGGDFREVTEAFTLKMTDLASSATLRGKCIETLRGLIHLEATLAALDVPFAPFDVFVEMLAVDGSELCNSSQPASVRRPGGGAVNLARAELRMNEGGLRVRPAEVNVRFTLSTPVATIIAAGRNDLLIRHAAIGNGTDGQSTLIVYRGSATITPHNRDLSPVTVRAGQAVDVSAERVGTVRNEGSFLYLPIIQGDN